MTRSDGTPRGFLTIADAADTLDVAPWHVVRLINSGDIESVELVRVDSLNRYRQESR